MGSKLFDEFKNSNIKKPKKGFDFDSYGHEVRLPMLADFAKPGDVGVEVEMEGLDLPNGIPGRTDSRVGWVVHQEGSLRNGGVEYVMDRPCPFDEVEQAVGLLYRQFELSGSALHPSIRTSTHVHINITDLKVNEIASFVCLWGMFEDVLVNWCGPTRSGNLFALRMADCPKVMNDWLNFFSSGFYYGAFKENNRYLALNPCAMQKFGSLEVRSLRGLQNKEMLINWVSLLRRIKELAKTTYKNPQDIANRFSGANAEQFFFELFEGLDQEFLAEILDSANKYDMSIDNSIWEGFRRIQPIAYCVPWSEFIERQATPYIPNPFNEASARPKPVKRPALFPDVWDAPRRDDELRRPAEDARVQAELARLQEVPQVANPAAEQRVVIQRNIQDMIERAGGLRI